MRTSRLAVLLVLLLAMAWAHADDGEEATLTPEQAADAVLVAVRNAAAVELGGLASRDDPDPWLVGDALCNRGESEAAVAFAAAVKGAEANALRAWVVDRRTRPAQPEVRRALDAADRALKAGAPEKALAATAAASGEVRPLLRVRLLGARGEALAVLGRLEEAVAAHLQAADEAESMGWLQCCGQALASAFRAAERGLGPRAAMPIAERRLRIARRRASKKDEANALIALGGANRTLGEGAQALSCWTRSLELWRELGNRPLEAQLLSSLGLLYQDGGDLQKARSHHERAVAIGDEIGDDEARALALGNLGVVLRLLGDLDGARAVLERSLRIREKLDRPAWVAIALEDLGRLHILRGEYDRALACHERALKLRSEEGDSAGMASSLIDVASVHYNRGHFDEAAEMFAQAAVVFEEIGHVKGLGVATLNLGMSHHFRGDQENALEHVERALALYEQVADRGLAASALGALGIIHQGLGDYPQALEHQTRCLALMEGMGNRVRVAEALHNLATVHRMLGNLPESAAHLERALAIQEALGLHPAMLRTLPALASVYEARGDWSRGLAAREKALALADAAGERRFGAYALLDLGRMHSRLRDTARALDLERRAEAELKVLGDKSGRARALRAQAVTHFVEGELEVALALHLEALELVGDSENPRTAAGAAITLGQVYVSLGRHGEARATFERALHLGKPAGDRANTSICHEELGRLSVLDGDLDSALTHIEKAQRDGEDSGQGSRILFPLMHLAWVHLLRGEYAEAVDTARRAVASVVHVSSGLAEEQGARVRERFANLFDYGIEAAVGLDSTEALAFFLESGRAGMLLESLGGRRALWRDLLPAQLRDEEARAHAAQRRAMTLFREAQARGRRSEMRRRKKVVEAAQLRVRQVTEKIQREAKAVAGVLYVVVDSLTEIQAGLSADEQLVLYALLEPRSLALVLTRESAEVVTLAPKDEIEEACRALLLEDPPYIDEEAVPRLRSLLVQPLGLSPACRRVLASPVGVLGYIPFALLLPAHEVVYVPSGTTLNLLRAEPPHGGKGVLALGDPDYRQPRDRRARAAYRAGLLGRLPPLPATRDEARAVGDVVLLGKEATETGFRRSVASRSAWRAVHLACHGLVDPEEPTLSSLALTPDAESDGFLSALEVFRLRIPADLVVLSACETGKGRIYHGEGIVGLTRAFLFAGAPRVLVSLWKVPDDATGALMAKFYELWNPPEESKQMALSAAAALRQAQAYVRDHPDHPDWHHPSCWAAWVLWGLGD